MSDENKNKAGWKQKLIHEIIEYFVNFVYLAIFFSVFTWYRRLILAEYHISYLNYGIGLLEALVLAKIIMVGGMLHLGPKSGDKPLIVPTLYKAVVFTVWVAVFGVLEHTLIGLLHGKGLEGGFHEIVSEGKDELLARCLIMFFAFIPFFAFQELGRVLGEGRINEIFFRRGVVEKH